MKEALFYERLDDNKVRCNTCERRCIILPGRRGACRIRENRDGKLYLLTYGHPVTINLDPIEKKPLFHFYPGTDILSYTTVGCNFFCKYCQNWDISQASPEDYPTPYVPPEEMVELALKYDSIGVAHTYTEPTVYYEYARDIGILAKEKGLVNVFVTNGYFTEEVLNDAAKFVDAMNIDLKGDEKFYREVVIGAHVDVVKRNIRKVFQKGIHLEVTMLIIPGYNDDEELFRQNVSFLAEISRDIPLHISRFFPHYKMKDVPPTPVETLIKFYHIAREELNYVYVGNLPDPRYETTYCPNCGNPVIIRHGYVVENLLEGDRCPYCGYKIHGVFEKKEGEGNQPNTKNAHQGL